MKYSLKFVIIGIIILLGSKATRSQQQPGEEGIMPSPKNPYYWQYKGNPLLLMGGTWQDKLFNHPNKLAEHLDLLVSVGGNYVRNTMSHRNPGNEFAFHKGEDGLFDLEKFNDTYWSRFQNFLDLCHERDIIVQLEIWDPWDHYEDHQSFGGWSYHPFNPNNNINYTEQESGLPVVVDYPPRSEPSEHGFFLTVPALDDNELVLKYQLAFMDKLLSIALEYPNILYCINNESGEHLEWTQFWAEHIHKKAEMEGIRVPVTEMRRQENIKAEDHRIVFDKPELYTFLDISQNNAFSGLGQAHYDNILEVRNYISDAPRPINNIKNYGAARHGKEESVARFCRIVFAGSASARFHRPHPIEDPNAHEASSDYGLGLSPRAQLIIKSLRLLADEFDFVAASPSNELLSDREENEAYLLAISGNQYALYFPKDVADGSVTLNISGSEYQWELRWINIAEAKWSDREEVLPMGNKLQLKKPESGHWLALIEKKSRQISGKGSQKMPHQNSVLH